jgi:peptidoglycan hydrolase CwlO-like protein
MKFIKRDQEALDLEDRCQSMTGKVDSLVKFLEEERGLRKEAQNKVQRLEAKMTEFQKQIM